MLKPFLFLLISSLLLTQIHSSVKLELPISQLTLAKVSLSIDKLEDLLTFFNTPLENKGDIYRRVELTKGYLDQMRTELTKYNNVVSGKANSVSGQKNLVVGNYNNVQGDNNWVFVSKFGGKINGLLLVGEWMVELEKSELILKSPRLAISYIDEAKNKALKDQYTSDKRQLVKWDKWTQPQNSKADRHWGRYVGYDDWKVSNWNQLNIKVDPNASQKWRQNSSNTVGGWSGSATGTAPTINVNSWGVSSVPSVGQVSAGSIPSTTASKNLSKPSTTNPISGGTPTNGWSSGTSTRRFGWTGSWTS